VNARDPEFGQASRFSLSSGARIDEVLHLRANKVFADERKVELSARVARPETSGSWIPPSSMAGGESVCQSLG
jgi:hypothetical protein